MGSYCGSCGAALSAEASFCGGCGATVSGSPGSVAASPGREWSVGLPLVLAAIAAGVLGYFRSGLLGGPWFSNVMAELGLLGSEVQFAFLIPLLCTLIFSPLSGMLVDRFGVRRVALPGVAAFALACAACGMIGSPNQFHVLTALVGIFAVTFSRFVMVVPICRTFTTWRGMAVALALAGIVVGQEILARVSDMEIAERGWREAFMLITLVLAVIVFFLVALLSAPQSRQNSFARNNTTSIYSFNAAKIISILLMFSLYSGLYIHLLTVHFSTMRANGMDLPDDMMRNTYLLYSLLGIFGMLLAGFAEDWWGGFWQLVVGYGLLALALALALLQLTDMVGPLAGFAGGMVTVSTIVRCSRLLPPKHCGLGLGIVASFGAGGSLVANML